jgi:hypothetical protein
MTIQGLINKIFRANQTQNNTVSWTGVNGLKTIQEDIVQTIRERTFFTVPTTADLVNQGFNNAVLCYVQDHAFFRWQANGIPNGTTIFPANDGGVWVQETLGDTDGTVTSIGLSMPAAFTVANSPVTTSGVISVIGAGNTAQYVRGDGTLATFPVAPGGGITSLNGLLPLVQVFAIGTSGTDFNISSVTATHTFNLPTASSTKRGALSSSDWTVFNNKQNALTFNSPLNNASNVISINQSNGTTNGYLSSTDWSTFNSKQNAITLTTAGTSGAATLVGSTLNIPNYTTTSATKYFGAWQHNINQTAAANNIGYGVRFSIGDITGQGVDVINDSLGNPTFIKMNNTGYYNIQFSFQFQNTDTSDQDVTIWLRKNGGTTPFDVTGSGGFVSVPSSHGGTPGHCIAAWNYFVQANSGDYFQLVWSTTLASRVTMEFYPAGSPPPSSASAILTVNQVN